MKIVHVSSTDQGGAAISCIRLHCGLLEMGIDSTLITISKKRVDIPEHFSFAKKSNLTYLQRIMLRLGLFTPMYLRHQQALQNKVKGYEHFSFPDSDFKLHESDLIKQADIVNLHWTAGYLDYSSFFSEINKNIVWTLHDMNAFTGGCHYSSGCDLYEKDCSLCPQLEGTKNRAITNTHLKIKQKSTEKARLTIVTPSQWLKSCAQKSAVFSKKTVHVIPYGLNLENFKCVSKEQARKELGLPLDKKIILFVSHSIENKRKGFDVLEKSLHLLTDSNQFALVSVGSAAIKKELKNYISLGEIKSEQQMMLAYNASDVFVLPSTEDNLPNVAIEAIACGVPVIGFNIGGMPDIVKEHFNGLLCNETNTEALAETIRQFFKEESRYDKEAIRKDAELRYDSKIQAKAYIQLYKELLNERK